MDAVIQKAATHGNMGDKAVNPPDSQLLSNKSALLIISYRRCNSKQQAIISV
jgi:hypothetical protein